MHFSKYDSMIFSTDLLHPSMRLGEVPHTFIVIVTSTDHQLISIFSKYHHGSILVYLGYQYHHGSIPVHSGYQ